MNVCPSDGPDFAPGDTVLVQVRIKEGDRERLQAFEGVVIGKRNRGLNSAFTVRKISHGVGVERTFQTHSQLIERIEVKRRGDVRQAKLYYLRDLTGRAARIAEKLGKKGEKAESGAKSEKVETSLDDTTTIAEQVEAAVEEDLAAGIVNEDDAANVEAAAEEPAVGAESAADEEPSAEEARDKKAD